MSYREKYNEKVANRAISKIRALAGGGRAIRRTVSDDEIVSAFKEALAEENVGIQLRLEKAISVELKQIFEAEGAFVPLNRRRMIASNLIEIIEETS